MKSRCCWWLVLPRWWKGEERLDDAGAARMHVTHSAPLLATSRARKRRSCGLCIAPNTDVFTWRDTSTSSKVCISTEGHYLQRRGGTCAGAGGLVTLRPLELEAGGCPVLCVSCVRVPCEMSILLAKTSIFQERQKFPRRRRRRNPQQASHVSI